MDSSLQAGKNDIQELDLFLEDEYDNRGLKTALIIMSVFAFLCVAVVIIKLNFTITKVEVIGNDHYTTDEIAKMVCSTDLEKNTIFLYLKNRFGKEEEIPFVEQMDVDIVSPTEVKVTVYEKALAGYVEYLGRYLYFDREGIIVESSTERMDGVPFVTGLKFDHMALYEPLPLENNKDVFKLILNITQLLTKYNIGIDKIYFNPDNEITLRINNVDVLLGSSDYIDEKINRLQFLLPRLRNRKGELHMENFTGEGGKFTFESEK
ncbi:MAG: cell division protein FtsQ/DivIB [Lachnospiraceae bacterium]|nr:cell division protein FtsQ/DivIB [Lachnospiraceae bacterium]